MKTKKPSCRSRILWFFVFAVLVALTLRTIVGESDSFSMKRLAEMIRSASPLWLIAALLCMCGFVLFEALSLRRLESFLGCRKTVGQNIIYSAADVYFSAITPSATGGQPASAVFMIRDGIPTAATTITLLLNLALYTVSLLVIGLLCFVFCPGSFSAFSRGSQVLIVLGFVFQSAIVIGLFLLVLKERIILKIASWGLRLLHKLHLVKDVEKKQESLHNMAQEYRECIQTFKTGKLVVLRVLLLNLLQRFCNIGVTVCVFLAVGGPSAEVLHVLFLQGYVLLGANAIPIPGAVGVTDILFLDGFKDLIPDTACVEMLSRGISFYVCLILCGTLVLVASLINAVKKHRERKQA